MSLGNLQCLAIPGTPREVTTSVHASGFHLAARRHLQMASGIMSTTPQNTLAQSKCIWLAEEDLARVSLAGRLYVEKFVRRALSLPCAVQPLKCRMLCTALAGWFVSGLLSPGQFRL